MRGRFAGQQNYFENCIDGYHAVGITPIATHNR